MVNWSINVIRHWLLVIGWLVLPLACCLSQTDSIKVIRDTTIVVPQASNDSLRTPLVRSEATSFHMKKSPWLSLGLSAALPGAGQFYNEDYWKVPVIVGLAGYWVYEWVKLNNKYKDYGDQYNQSLIEFPPSGNSQYQRLRDYYRDERDKFAWYLGALYFVNLVDAYVGAHLYDFDVTPELSSDGKIVPKVTATIRLKL